MTINEMKSKYRRRKARRRQIAETVAFFAIVVGALCAECIPVLIACVLVAGCAAIVGGLYR